ncbi:hypothetical protein ACYFX5_09015 [Bremerella sp. T1]|uniref:hypothetical protein n=1 Tax=Bremerella sp. TYQ1 TaxID=3119568 RepID=UPI001CCDB841|nr:hypothetical protein [Bremerella volcania]UBM38393.1 hypothetical protein LA756_10945 [Bremerella volcania]
MKQSLQSSAGKWISVSAPGGMARQVFVDAFDATERVWKRVGTFADRPSAEKKLTTLKLQGTLSRIVSQNFCPTGR